MDLIKIFKFTPKKDIRVLAGGAINAIKKSGIVVELNSAGLRKPANEIYPKRRAFADASGCRCADHA